MVGLPFLVSQCAKLHVAGWTWAVFTSVYSLFLRFVQRQSGIFWIRPRILTFQLFLRHVIRLKASPKWIQLFIAKQFGKQYFGNILVTFCTFTSFPFCSVLFSSVQRRVYRPYGVLSFLIYFSFCPFAQLRKSTISFVTSVSLPVRPKLALH
jgi:hypothetical protein